MEYLNGLYFQDEKVILPDVGSVHKCKRGICLYDNANLAQSGLTNAGNFETIVGPS